MSYLKKNWTELTRDQKVNVILYGKHTYGYAHVTLESIHLFFEHPLQNEDQDVANCAHFMLDLIRNGVDVCLLDMANGVAISA